MVGYTREELRQVSSMTLATSIDTMLTVPGPVTPPVNDYEAYLRRADPGCAAGNPWVFTQISDGDIDFARRLSYIGWLYDNMMNHELSVHEKMVLFWHNLLVTDSEDLSILNYQYMDMLRSHALGNYKDIIINLTLNPRMLNYLNGSRNVAQQPDENYARELQELFCIGKWQDSQYTENDVREAARVLTGWYNDFEEIYQGNVPEPKYWEGNHDTGNKQFSSFYGNRVIQGRVGQNGGYTEIMELIDMIFENPVTAKHLCRKLWQYFVHTEITADVELNVIEPLAELLIQENFEVEPVLRTLLSSEAFFDQSFRGALVKSPAEFLIGTWKTLELNYDDPNDLTQKFYTRLTLNYYLDRMGMELGSPPSVAGWAPYYQEPLRDKAWITTDTVTFRAQVSDMISSNGIYINNNGDVLWLITDFVKLLESFDEPDNIDSLIRESTLLFLGLELSDEQKEDLKSVLLSGQSDEYYWWDAWNSYKNFPENEMYRTTVENRLRPFFRVLFQYSEFNLM